MIAALLLLACPPVFQEGAGALTVGHFIEVRGEFAPDERFVAEKVELLDPNSEVLIGTVPADQTDPTSLSLFGQYIEIEPDTEWKGIEPGPLAGQRVQIVGRWKGPRKFSARRIQPRGPGRDRIAGRINALKAVEGGLEAEVMIFHVFLPDGIEFESAKPVAEVQLAPARAVGVPSEDSWLSRDEDDDFGRGTALSDTLRFMGQLELRTDIERDYDLRSDRDNDRDDFEGTARLRLVWNPSEKLTGLVEARYRHLYRLDTRNGVDDTVIDHSGTFGETWLQFRDVFDQPGFDVTVGRQDFDDLREWIYDENLDALRFTWLRPGWRLDLSASTTINGGRRNEESTNLIGYLSNNNEDEHLGLWTVYRDIGAFDATTGSIPAERTWHTGARVIGAWVPDNEAWADFAYLKGERFGQDISAWGYDVGTTWFPGFADPYYVSIGYALGSGDNDGSGTDGNFRQTGFQDNTGRFGGVTSFRYYGELFDPELSNMGIFTLGLGRRFGQRISLDAVFHTYTQDAALDFFSPQPNIDANLNRRPNGIDAELGRELDLIFGYRQYRSWDLEVVGAWYDPGAAFDVPGVDSTDAYLLKIQLRYRF